MNDPAQSAIDTAFAKGVRGMEVAQEETTTIAQALALSLAMVQVLSILEAHVSEKAAS